MPASNDAISHPGDHGRSPEFQQGRNILLQQINEVVDEVRDARTSGRATRLGSSVLSGEGVVETVLDNPYGSRPIIARSTNRSKGVYFHHDEKTGRDGVVYTHPDGRVIEFTRNNLRQALVISDVAGEPVWQKQFGLKRSDTLASFSETYPDGGGMTYAIGAEGDIYKTTVEPGRHGLRSTTGLGNDSVMQISGASDLLTALHHELFLPKH